MFALIQNEMYKMIHNRKMLLIILMLVVFISLFTYGEHYIYKNTLQRFESIIDETAFDWTLLAKQQLETMQDRLDSPYIPDSGLKSIQVEIEQLQYFIDNDINPITPSATRFSGDFAEQSLNLLIPLLILVLSADLVSGEFSKGTIKLLLTRSIPRWKILLSKYLALLIMTTWVVFLMGILSLLISGLAFGYWGFSEPIATGFRFVEGSLDPSCVVTMTRIRYLLLVYSLAWGVSIIIATITMMVSTLVRTSASTIGIIIASLIGGQFLQYFLSDWPVVRYFFVSNLNLSKYLSGAYQPIAGMSLIFSTLVLALWGAVSLTISFIVFTKQDVLI